MRTSIKFCCSYYLFIFLLVDPPFAKTLEIQKFTYRTKQLDIVDQSITSNIITLEVDQDLYHKVQCGIDFSETNRAQFVPCCTANNTIACYNTTDIGQRCLDSNSTSFGGVEPASNFQQYSFKVSNYQTCHTLSILANAISGQLFLAVSIRQEFSQVSLTSHDILRSEYGSNGVSLCCDQIREWNPAWTGEVYVGWQPLTATQYEFSLWTDPILPVTQFYMIPPVDIQCDGLHFSSDDCRERSGCLPTPATNDPLFSLLKGMGGVEKVAANEKQFSTGIIIRKDQFANVKSSASVSFPFPQARFSDPSCIFTFPTLANNQSELLGNSVGVPTENHIDCDPIQYNETLTEFRSRASFLGSSRPQTYQETTTFLLQTIAWPTSDAWTSCTELINRGLLDTVASEVSLQNTIVCLESNRSDSYLDDPCCNPSLQRVECCFKRDVSAVVDNFQINEAGLERCGTPRCASNVLSDYIVLSNSSSDRSTGCAVRTTQSLGSGVNVLDDINACLLALNKTACTSDAPCKAVSASSFCRPDGRCAAPCQVDNDCATGVCEEVAGTNGLLSCTLYDYNNIQEIDEYQLMNVSWRCIEHSVEPFSLLFVKQDVGLNATSTRDELLTTLLANYTEQKCVGANKLVSFEDCNSLQTCNWAVCNSMTDPFCNQANCTDPNLGSDYFCGTCQSGFCVETSLFSRCEYNAPTNEECQAVGGSFNGLAYKYVTTKCIRPNVTKAQCFPPEFCSGSPNSCASAYCYAPDYAEANCTQTSFAGIPLQWQSWTVNSQTYGVCATVSPASNYFECTNADLQLRWWPGSKWISGQLTSQSQCESVGFCGDTPTLKVLCDSQYTCSDGVSDNQEICESNGVCNDFDGCVFDWDSDFNCLTQYDWTPLGCHSRIIADNTTCVEQGGKWLTKATTRAECEDKSLVCREPKLSVILYLFPTERSNMPAAYSLKAPDDCSACGGTPFSYYSWAGGQWRPKIFTPFSWHKREMIQSNRLFNQPSYDYLFNLISASIARRYAKIMESDMWCRYGQFTSEVSSLVCDCAGGGEDCFSGVSSSVVGVGLACSNLASNFSTSVATIIVGSDFLVQGNDCINIRTNAIPMSQFATKEVASISAASVTAAKTQLHRSVLFIRNDQGIVVGEIIGNGIKLDRDTQSFTGTLQGCITFPTYFEAQLDSLSDFRWAMPNEQFTSFTLLNESTQLGETSCFALVNASQTYFPVGLQSNWQSATFVATLLPGQIVFLVIGIVWYFTIFVFTGYHFVLHILLHVPEAQFFTLSTTALFISIIFLLNRVIYMILLLFGVMDQNSEVDVVFSSFPALLFYIIYSIIVIRWAEIYHFTLTAGAKQGISKLRPAIIAMNVVLFVAFALLIILYFSLQDLTPAIYSCATPDNVLNTLSVGDIVSIVYKAFFAAVSAVLSAMFVIYGARVLVLMHRATNNANTTKDRKQAREAAFRRLMAVSAVCTIALLAQAVFLLWSSATSSTSQSDDRFYGILTFLYLTEMPPAIIFVVMFKKASEFVKNKSKSMTGLSQRTSEFNRDSTVSAPLDTIETDRNTEFEAE